MSDNNSSKNIEELQRKLKILQVDIAACGVIMENSFKTASEKVSKEIDASKYKLMSLAVSASNSYAKINSELDASCKSIFAKIKTNSSSAVKKIKSAGETIQICGMYGQDACKKISESIKKVSSNSKKPMKNVTETIKSCGKNGEEACKKAEASIKSCSNTMDTSAKEISKSSEKAGTKISESFKSAFSSVKKVCTGIATSAGKAFSSIKDIYKDNASMKDFQDKLGSIKKELGGVKDVLIKAFEPIVTSVMPILTNLLTYFEPLIGQVSKFVEKLFGLDSISPIAQKLTAVFEKVANSIKDAIGGIDFSKLKGSIEKVWASAQPIIGNLIDIFGSFFTEILVPLAAWTISDVLPAFFNLLSGALNVLNPILEVLKDLGSWLWNEFLQPIASWTGGIIVDVLTELGETLDSIGKWIAEHKPNIESLGGSLDGILSIVKNLTSVFGEMWKSVAGAIGEIDFSKLIGSIEEIWTSAQPIIGNLIDAFGSFFTEILVPLAEWTISNVLPEFFNLVSGALDILNPILEAFMELGGWLWSEFLQPIAEWTGGVIIDVLSELSGILDSIGKWISENKSLIEDIALVIGAFAAAWGLVTLAMNAYNIITVITTSVSTVLSGALSILGSVIGFLTSPIGLVVIAIGAIIAIGLLLYNHCEAFRNFISAVFVTTFSAAFEFIKCIFEGFLKNVGNIIDAVKTFFCGIIDFIAGVFTGNWERAISGIVGIFKSIWQGIEAAAKAPLNRVIALVNGVISGLNKISFNLGGKHFGVNIPKIPYLAKGGIVNVPTLAMVGENGREAVMPLENNTGWITNLADKISSRMYQGNENNYSGESGNIIFQIDGSVIGEVALKQMRRMQRQGGITVIPV